MIAQLRQQAPGMQYNGRRFEQWRRSLSWSVVAIAVGGSAGALMRYGVSLGVHSWLGRGFPWGTLTVNVAGSFLMGLLAVMLLERMALGPEWRAAVLVGFLGSFTTFSAFSLETLALVEQGETARAAINIIVSVMLCLFAAWVGLLAGRAL
jgi:CrcB protein